MQKITNLQLTLFNLIFPIGSISFAWYLQIYQNVIPCSLCLLQRWGMYLSIFFITCALICSLFKFRKTSIVFIVGSIFSNIISLIMAGRNVWLQHLPADQIPSCGLDLETLLDVVPFLEAIKKTFQGSGECAEVGWLLLGQSLAFWATIFFTFYLFLQIMIVWKLIKNKNV